MIISYFVLRALNRDFNGLIIFGIPLFGMVLFVSRSAFQWVTFTEKGIYAMSIYGLIKFCLWEDIQKIEEFQPKRHYIHEKCLLVLTDKPHKEDEMLPFNGKYTNLRIPINSFTKSIIKEKFIELENAKYFSKNYLLMETNEDPSPEVEKENNN